MEAVAFIDGRVYRDGNIFVVMVGISMPVLMPYFNLFVGTLNRTLTANGTVNTKATIEAA